jgi:CDP-paratose synthetase
MSKHFLITGGTGFLGSNLVKELSLNKIKLSIVIRPESSMARLDSISRDLNFVLIDNLDLFFRENKIDGIIHLATNYGRKGENLNDIINSNLVFPVKLINLAVENDVRFFINTDTSLPRNLNAYSLSKAQFKDWLKQVSGSLKIVNIVPEYFYGPNDDDTKFITGIINKLDDNVDFIDFTSGIQQRDFIYIDDIISAYMCVIKNIEDLGSYSEIPVGTSSTISLRSLVELIKGFYQDKKTILNFGKLPLRQGEIMESKADITILKSMGWSPAVGIEEGIGKIIDLKNKK